MTKKQQTKKGANNKLSEFPLPTRLEFSEAELAPHLRVKGFKPNILTRLTIVITNNDFLIHFNKSEVVQQYDLLAVVPRTTQTVLSLLKSSFRWDILSLSPELIVGGVRWSRKLYLECVDKNVHFELVYGPCILNTEDRRRIISLAHMYHAVGRSKNIFFASGAMSPVELRSPDDVANLAFVFGMNENQGKEAVRAKCLAIFRAAIGRKMGPYRVRVEKCISSETLRVCKSSESELGSKDGGELGAVTMETDS
jgi:ribonuclease P/MRP protein subunit RPP1